MNWNIEIGRLETPAASFGSTLRRLRTEAGLSVNHLADKIHYSRSFLTKIEGGSRTPTLELAKACDAALESGRTLQELIPAAAPLNESILLRPIQLPGDPGLFVGRDDALADLDQFLLSDGTSGRAVALYGSAGAGKTWLAVHWAHQVRDAFPDGILFVNLRGDIAPDAHASPSAILGDWLRNLGVSEALIPAIPDDRTILWRTLLASRRMLIVLDNAASSAQIRPLLPASPTCTVIITSRTRLTDLSMRDGVRYLPVPPFSLNEATALLGRVLGPDAVDADPRAAARLATRAGHHPLTLRQIAEHALTHPDLTLADLAEDAEGDQAGLSETAWTEDPAVRWNRQPREDDIERPSISRAYDFYLGGALNFKADRDFARRSEEILPDVKELAQLNRRFLARSVRFCAERGVRQFIDIGAGIPNVGSTHDIARQVNPECRVVYVDNEAVTYQQIRITIAGMPGVGVVHADFRDVSAVLHNPATEQLIDLDEPVVIVAGLLLHFIPDEDDPATLLASYRAAVAPGSYVVISHDTADGREQDMRDFAEHYSKARLLIPRSYTEIARLVAGFDLVEPGIVYPPLWHPDPFDPPHEHPERTCIYVLVAQTPANPE